MIGLTYPDTGTVYFKDTQVAPDVVLSLRREMGYVIQEGGLFPHLTARDNVTLMARYVGWSGDRIEKRIDELSDLAQVPRRAEPISRATFRGTAPKGQPYESFDVRS
jgi:osmoprotectant transport system ATP-binding protein